MISTLERSSRACECECGHAPSDWCSVCGDFCGCQDCDACCPCPLDHVDEVADSERTTTCAQCGGKFFRGRWFLGICADCAGTNVERCDGCGRRFEGGYLPPAPYVRFGPCCAAGVDPYRYTSEWARP